MAINNLSGTCGTAGWTVTWELDDSGTLTFGGKGYMYSYGASYAPTAPWHDYADSIKTVVIGNGILSIGQRAFEGCSKLTSVTIPDSVKSIDSHAFDQ